MNGESIRVNAAVAAKTMAVDSSEKRIGPRYGRDTAEIRPIASTSEKSDKPLQSVAAAPGQ